jgi:Neprosin
MSILWVSYLRALATVMVLAAIGTSASAQTSGGYRPRDFITFSQFLSESRAKRLADFPRGENVGVRDEAAFEEMKRHLLSLYEGVHVAHSFFEAGHYVDCVPIDQQPSLRGRDPQDTKGPPRAIVPTRPPKAQAGDRPPGKTQTLDLRLTGKKDPFGRRMACAARTIPMRRVTLEGMVRFESLNAFLRGRKIDDGSLDRPREQRPADGGHYYARGYQFVDNFGGDAWLNVWSPKVQSNEMSLSQLWIVGSEGEGKQTVEACWQVYPDKWSSDQAALFIFYTTKNYKDGCYNLDCTGFVQVASNVYLGRGFDHYSAIGRGQWGFNLQWKRHTTGDWWLFYKGPSNYIAVGYYPKSLFGDGALASKATKIAFGGEDSSVPAALEIGSGRKASEGWQKSAFQNFAFYIDTSTTSQWAKLDKQEIVSACYTTDIHNIFGSWGTYLYFGGPKCDQTP